MNQPRKSSSNRGPQQKEAAPLSLDYNHISRLCLKYWKWLVAGVAVGFISGYFYAASQTPIYAAQASILVNEKDASNDVVTPDGIGDGMIKTYEQLLQTKDLAERAVKNQNLQDNPEFLPPGIQGPVSQDAAAGILASEMSIHIRLGTRLIDIMVEHPSNRMAALLANELAKAAVEQYVDQHTGSGNGVADSLQKQVDQLQQQLAKATSDLKAYEASHGIVESSNEGQTSQESVVTDLDKQLSEAQEQVTLLEGRYGPQHPKLIAAKELVDDLKNQLNKAQGNAVDQSDTGANYTSLKSNSDSLREQLDTTLKQLHTVQAQISLEIPAISVQEEATVPYGPVRPNKPKIVATGGFLGLMAGLAFIMALYFMDSSLRTVSQAEATLGLPVIAAVPILTESDGRSVLPTFSDPQSFVAESFRGLRASLILHDREHPLKTVLVGSAIPGEGKSFCAANLAVAFAQAGLKTLLIDADLRLPTTHTYFNIASTGEPGGFTQVLSGQATLAEATVVSQIPNLSLLLAVIAADSPAELLSSARLPVLLEEVARTYDRVVIDSAPLNAVSDTMLILPKADAILLVVRAAQTPAAECKAALQKISSSNLKPLGLILNYLAAHTLKSYAYGYSYGQKPPGQKSPKPKNAK
jgi:capsular exopolysaccharide synthesis family protein